MLFEQLSTLLFQMEIAFFEALDGKIPAGVVIELLVSVNTSLVAISLAPEMQGIYSAMQQILCWDKPVYIRPSQEFIHLSNNESKEV